LHEREISKINKLKRVKKIRAPERKKLVWQNPNFGGFVIKSIVALFKFLLGIGPFACLPCALDNHKVYGFYDIKRNLVIQSWLLLGSWFVSKTLVHVW
jgi:hypothetical protein